MAGKIIAIIGARLNSSRLPAKQLLPLAGKPVIARLVDRLRTIDALDDIIVATTNDPLNQRLVDWAEGYGVKAFAWGGDENDVMGRVDAVIQAENADVIAYVCGDSPLVEPSTIAALITATQRVQYGGIAQLAPPAEGSKYIHEGFDVFGRAFWDQMIEVAHEPFEREHVGAVYHHLAKVTPSEIALVPENPVFATFDHRLSVDTPKDYQFMARLYGEWYDQHPIDSLVDLKWVISRLKGDPALAAMNAHVHQKSVGETSLKVLILCEAGPDIGLGHVTRACVAAGSLQEHLGAGVELLVRGHKTDFAELDLLRHQWVDQFEGQSAAADIIIADVKTVDQDVLGAIKQSGATLAVGIDVAAEHSSIFDTVWMPSFHIETAGYAHSGNAEVHYGLDCFLLRSVSPRQESTTAAGQGGRSVIVLTGGADPKRLSSHLPDQLIKTLPKNTKIDWVQGPYASDPVVTEADDRFSVLVAPENLHEKLASYDMALCVFGVTYFECLKAGLPTIVFDPIGAAQPEEWRLVADMFKGYAAHDVDQALALLSDFLKDPQEYKFEAVQESLQQGPRNFAATVQAAFETVKERNHAAA